MNTPTKATLVSSLCLSLTVLATGCPGDEKPGGNAGVADLKPFVSRPGATKSAEPELSDPAPSGSAPAASSGPVGWRKSLAGASAPSSPARGKISGLDFRVEKAVLKEGGTLELRQGEDFFADRQVTVFVPGVEVGDVPEGRTVEVPEPVDDFGQPHVHYSWKPNADAMPKTEIEMNKYTLLLQFGSEGDDDTIDGRIWLCLPDANKSWVAGSFTAKIEGFRIRDGKPDMTTDSFKTLHVAAQARLEADAPGKKIEITDTDMGQFSHPGKQAQTGQSEVTWKTDGADEQTRRFQFLKDEETGWAVHAVLGMDQITEAHPILPMTEKTFGFLSYVLAKHMEAELNQSAPGTPLNEVRVSGGGRGKEFATASISYKLGDAKEATKRRFVMRKSADGWAVGEEMAANQKLDYKTGKLVPK